MSRSGAPRSVVVLGGSVAGSAAALQLARAGWRVSLVDPALDRVASPGQQVGPRPGAPHTVHAHSFGSRANVELQRRLPDVHAALLEAERSGDRDLTILQVRRHTFRPPAPRPG